MAGPRHDEVPGRFAAVYDGYAAALGRSGLAADTRRAYGSRVRDFLAYLGSLPASGADPLADVRGRDDAKRGYLAYLLGDRQVAAGTARAHLAAVENLYAHLGLGKVRGPRDVLPPRPPRTLDAGEQERYLRAVGGLPLARDRAIGYLLFHSGLRVSELVALDVGDVQMPASGCTVTVRSGDRRSITLPDPAARAALAEWIAERAGWPGPGPAGALFLNRRGRRLSARTVGTLVSGLAAEASLAADDGRPAGLAKALRRRPGAHELPATAARTA